MKTRKSPSVIFNADEAPSSSITKSSIATPYKIDYLNATWKMKNASAELP
jgi:hypothetical protein